jgi:hypothetical protein
MTERNPMNNIAAHYRDHMACVQRIHDLVVADAITPYYGALYLEALRMWSRRWHRRLLWRSFFDGITLGPVWRWLFRSGR